VLIKTEAREAGTSPQSTPCEKNWLPSAIFSPSGGERERAQEVENKFFNILLERMRAFWIGAGMAGGSADTPGRSHTFRSSEILIS
jgi:hypothetical protein